MKKQKRWKREGEKNKKETGRGREEKFLIRSIIVVSIHLFIHSLIFYQHYKREKEIERERKKEVLIDQRVDWRTIHALITRQEKEKWKKQEREEKWKKEESYTLKDWFQKNIIDLITWSDWLDDESLKRFFNEVSLP